MRKSIIIETVLYATVIAGFTVWYISRSPDRFAPQETVNALVALQPTNDSDQVMQLLKSGSVTNKFDVNQYFMVLDALRPETGYVLDWVYWQRGGLGGLPVLYARKTDAPPYTSFDNYVAVSTNGFLGKTLDEFLADESCFFGYLDKVHVEDTPEGFFQLVLLRLLGDRFHLWWHEYYRETFLVCSKRGWEALLLRETERGQCGQCYNPPPAEFVAAAAKIDFSPRIRLGEQQVEINVMTYCPFQGLNLHYFAIARVYPHRILKHTQRNMLSHSQHFRF